MPHNFKGKYDTVGNTAVMDIKREEERLDVFCEHPLMGFYLLRDKYERDKAPMQKALIAGSDKLKTKSPFQTTGRFVAYIEDDLERYNKLKQNLPPDNHIIYSNRNHRQELENEITGMDGITKCHVFYHNKSFDSLRAQDFPAVEERGGRFICRYCAASYVRKIDYAKHEARCDAVVRSGRARHVIQTINPCYCNDCNGDMNKNCNFQHLKGEVKKTWLIPKQDMDQIKERLQANTEMVQENENAEKAIKLIRCFFQKFLGLEIVDGNTLPSNETISRLPAFGSKEIQGTLRANDVKILTEVLGLVVTRTDGQSTRAPLKSDHEASLNNVGWRFIIDQVTKLM